LFKALRYLQSGAQKTNPEPPVSRGESERVDYVTDGEIARRMGVGINSGRKALQQMRQHPKFPPKTIGGKRYWPSVVDFLNLWNNRIVDAPGISAGQEQNHGQTTNSGRARPRLAAAKERLGRDLAGYQEGLQTCDTADHGVRPSADRDRGD